MAKITELLTQGVLDNRRLDSAILGAAPSNLLHYYPCRDLTGTQARDFSPNANHGTYSNVTLAAATYKGQPVPSFNGTSSVLTFPSTVLGTKGSGVLIARVSGAGVWTDGVVRYLLRVQVDANNLLHVIKSATNNRVDIRYRAGGTEKTLSITTTTLDFFKLVWTYGDSANGNTVAAWFNGTAQTSQTGFGAFTGSITTKNYGENSANSFSGNEFALALWNAILPQSAIDSLNAA